ncbi:class I SAM-dependent methyltransferase [Patescibacteria group bacterium]|nr:class I SAM-dependent methyltransferase [Patescibacteria group bacterium]
MKNYTICNLCKNNDYSIVFNEGVAQKHQIVKCNTCGLMYANPQGEAESKTEMFLQTRTSKDLSELTSEKFSQKQSVQLKDYKKIISTINNIGIKTGSVLEIGASLGTFLNMWKESGWNVLGVDPNKNASIYAKEKYNINVIQSTIKESDLKENQFDVVIMLHVIEHMGDPEEELEIIKRVLKPGGILVIETPRYDSLLFKCLGRRERSISCDGHIYFFTTKTIRALIEGCGFNIMQLDLVGRTLTIDRLFYNFGVISKSVKIKRYLQAISRKIHADNFIIHLNFHDMMRVYCRNIK